MRAFHRPGFLTVLLLLAAVLFTGQRAVASHFRYANVRWCAGAGPVGTGEFRFIVEIAERRYANQMVGDIVTEFFDFGDSTTMFIPLTVTEVHEAEGWFLAKGEVVHRYNIGSMLIHAGFHECCRINGSNGNDFLNNRNDGTLQARARLVSFLEEECSPVIGIAPVVRLNGGIGDTFTIPVPVTDGNPVRCRLATSEEAGGGPNPAGMTIDPDTCVITWTPPAGDPTAFWTTQVIAEQLDSGGFPIIWSVADFLLQLDRTPPVCRVDSLSAGPPATINIFIQDGQSGLASINVLLLTNATINIPAFSPGFTGSLIVVGTKIDQSQASQIQLKVTDMAGNMIECDPVLTEEARGTGRPESHVFPGILSEEHVVTILNGTPGLTQVQIDVNGRKFTVAGLQDGEERTIDVGSAVVPGTDSTFTLTTHGKPGGTAAIMIWDGNTE